MLTLKKDRNKVFFFKTPVNDFLIDDTEDREDDDIIAVPFESDSLISVGFIVFHYRKLGDFFFA